MARSVNFSLRDVQLLPNDAKKGSLLKLPADVKTVKDGEIIIPVWGRVLLSELVIDALTTEQRSIILKELKVSGQQIVFTIATGIEIEHGAIAVIDKAGDIAVPKNAIAGTTFTVIDPLRKLSSQSNVVVAETGHTIAAGQLKSGVVAGSNFDLSSIGSGYLGGGIRFVLGDSDNWMVDCAIGDFIPGSGAETSKPSIEWVGSKINTDGNFVVSARITA